MAGRDSPYPCGQCKPCRINQRRVWTARLLLESCLHSRTWFVTLTYAPDFLPTNGTLVPKHLQDWLKRLRFHVAPSTFRYYAVGEYGDRHKRPHYHAIIYGCDRADFPELVRSTWGLGLTQCVPANPATMQYVCGYVLKKVTSWKETAPDLVPEFARMSRRPGLGAGAVSSLAAAFNTSAVSAEIAARGDVPSTVRLDGGIYPLGRYVKLRLRVEAGYPETDPTYRLAAMMARPLQTKADRKAARLDALGKARRTYRSRSERAKL